MNTSVLKALVGVSAVLATVAIGATVYYLYPTASNQGYFPEQPIPFSHELHAGQNKIDCLYCHGNAEKSAHASVPSGNVCMNCHLVVKTDSPHIQRLTEAYNNGEPMPWIRIHQLPDHVQFNHSRHVKANVSCQTCHGPVETMEKVYQSESLRMGWCMDCHRGVTTPRETLNTIYPEAEDARNLPVAPLNCSTCHY